MGMIEPRVAVSSILHHSGGYSELARNLCRALFDLNALKDIELRDGTNFQPIPYETFCSEEYVAMEKFLKERREFSACNMLIQMLPPFMFYNTNEGIMNVGCCMFETRVPDSWFERLKEVSYLLVHDEFQRQLFSRVKEKLINWTPWVNKPNGIKYLKKERIILSVGVARVHKNMGKLIQAFGNLRLEDWRLVIKCSTEDPEGDDFRRLAAETPNVTVICGPLSTQAMDNLYENCDLYVSPTMCEGLNMPAIKAGMLNKPMIIAKHSGHVDWLADEIIDRVHILPRKELDMSTLPCIHPRYREKNMPGYDCTVEQIEDKLLFAVGDIEDDFAPDYGEYFVKKYSRGACRESLKKALEIISSDKHFATKDVDKPIIHPAGTE